MHSHYLSSIDAGRVHVLRCTHATIRQASSLLHKLKHHLPLVVSPSLLIQVCTNATHAHLCFLRHGYVNADLVGRVLSVIGLISINSCLYIGILLALLILHVLESFLKAYASFGGSLVGLAVLHHLNFGDVATRSLGERFNLKVVVWYSTARATIVA